MKKFLLATVALAALGATSPALGADIGARPYYNKAPAYAAPLYNWTGFYLGGHVGGAFSGSNTFNGLVLSDYDARLLGGVQAGADYQFAPNWVVGVEGQYSWLGSNNLSAIFPDRLRLQQRPARDSASITGRVGYTWGPALFYVKGGYAYSNNRDTLTFGGAPVAFTLDKQSQQRLHRRRRRRIHVRAELVGQGRVSVLRLRHHPLRDPGRAGPVRHLP